MKALINRVLLFLLKIQIMVYCEVQKEGEIWNLFIKTKGTTMVLWNMN